MTHRSTNPAPRSTNGPDNRHPQEPITVNTVGEYFSGHHYSSTRPTNIRGVDHADRIARPRNESSHYASGASGGYGGHRASGHDSRYEQVNHSNRHGSSNLSRQEPGSCYSNSLYDRDPLVPFTEDDLLRQYRREAQDRETRRTRDADHDAVAAPSIAQHLRELERAGPSFSDMLLHNQTQRRNREFREEYGDEVADWLEEGNRESCEAAARDAMEDMMRW